MMFRTILVLLLTVLFAILVAGCASPFQVSTPCPDPNYKPVLILGDENITRILGHETPSGNAQNNYCTNLGGANIRKPHGLKKFDFAVFNTTQLNEKLRNDQELSIWIYGVEHIADLKQTEWDPVGDGIDTFSGSLRDKPGSTVTLTMSNKSILGTVRLGYDEAFEIESVAPRNTTLGWNSSLNIIYRQQDVEPYSIDLSNDVRTVANY